MKRVRSSLLVGVLCAAMLAPTSFANADDDVWDELRVEDGVVLLFRHALAPGGGDPANFDVTDCSTQRNLSSAGRAQAREMGRQLQSENVDVSRVLSSPWCRSRETAELMDLGPVRSMMRLGSVFTAPSVVSDRREKRALRTIARHAQRDGVLVIVGHQANIIDLTDIAPKSGEGVAVRYRDNGTLEVLGRVPAPEMD
jgi:phosphohistidine phosphatase SixA